MSFTPCLLLLTVSNAADPVADAVVDAVADAVALEEKGMTTLAVWGGANVLVGATGWALSDDARSEAFHTMNAGWGAINLGLAMTGLATTRRAMSPTARKERWLRLPSIFAFNAGLDVAYISAGAWLWRTGAESGDLTREGWGQSVVLQGSALMIFDLVMAREFNDSNRRIWLSSGPSGSTINGVF